MNQADPQTNDVEQLPHENSSETQAETKPSLLARATNAIKEFASISELMRLFGAIGVLASMSIFLLQGWTENSDIERFIMIIAQTLLLAIGGFAMHKGLKENKSARLFFGLSLVSITVNFTTLGALFYSVFKLDSLNVQYPAYAHWVASDVGTISMAMVASFVILVPLALFAFSVLSRPAAKSLTAWYIGLNALLLIPIRDPNIVLIIAVIALYALSRVLFKKGSPLGNWKTPEGKFARATLFVPLIVFMTRSLLWYNLNDMGILLLWAAAYVGIRYLATLFYERMNSLTNTFALVIGYFMAGWLSFVVLSTVDSGIPLFAALFSLVCVDIYRMAKQSPMKRFTLFVGALLTLTLMFTNQLLDDSFLNFSLAIATGVSAVILGYKMHSKLVMAMGVLMTIGLSLLYAENVISALFQTGWLGLAISSVTVIILASVLDRYGAVLKLKFQQKKTTLEEF